MPSNKIVYISAAGSGKTTRLINEAIKNTDKKIIIITYTINNLNQIRKGFYDAIGVIPPHVTVQSWFSFLLTDCVRPYQNFVYDKHRIETVLFQTGRSTTGIAKSDVEKYYLAGEKYIYTDKISEFACLCNSLSQGLVIKRLREIYDSIYIDEIQDLAGYDFDLLDLFLDSTIDLLLVGDNRQATFSTNQSAKYKKFKGSNIIDLFKEWEKEKRCSLLFETNCHRCNQVICNFADALYPDMPATTSHNKVSTGHDGIYLIGEKDVHKYMKEFNPVILRYNKTFNIKGFHAINFGDSKGLSFDRVLILPHGPIRAYLEKGEVKAVDGSKEKFYVAITRARYSVGFVYDGKCAHNINKYS